LKNGKDVSSQLVEVGGCLPSVVTFALGLPALEPHGKAAATTAERGMERFGLQQGGSSEEARATGIGKPEGSILYGRPRQILTSHAAGKKNQEPHGPE
jgi:hypothetical protein